MNRLQRNRLNTSRVFKNKFGDLEVVRRLDHEFAVDILAHGPAHDSAGVEIQLAN